MFLVIMTKYIGNKKYRRLLSAILIFGPHKGRPVYVCINMYLYTNIWPSDGLNLSLPKETPINRNVSCYNDKIHKNSEFLELIFGPHKGRPVYVCINMYLYTNMWPSDGRTLFWAILKETPTIKRIFSTLEEQNE